MFPSSISSLYLSISVYVIVELRSCMCTCTVLSSLSFSCSCHVKVCRTSEAFQPAQHLINVAKTRITLVATKTCSLESGWQPLVD
jgi:hypothetical protein